MKNTYLFALSVATSALLALSLGGCSSSSSGSGGAGGTGSGGGATSTSTSTSVSTSTSTSTSTSSGMSFTPPTLGAQMDRMGRPAINTALNHTFDVDPAAKGKAKDAYNADTDPTKWADNYAAEFAHNLALLDGIDTVCGNQILAKPMVVKDRYADAAGALADDRLWLKTDTDTCSQYLAVELDATKIKPNTDCGGRKLDYDPIDASYSALAAGVLSGVGDGVDADADTKGTTFPYLAAPH